MPASRLSRQPLKSRVAATPAALDTRFPRAVRGEDYSRYAAAVWGQAVRWLRTDGALAVKNDTREASTVLREAAGACVERELYPQEEQLLSELLQREMRGIVDEHVRTSPEIPGFLRVPK